MGRNACKAFEVVEQGSIFRHTHVPEAHMEVDGMVPSSEDNDCPPKNKGFSASMLVSQSVHGVSGIGKPNTSIIVSPNLQKQHTCTLLITLPDKVRLDLWG